MMTGKSIKLKCGLMAFETVLGWTLIGPLPSSERKSESTLANMVTSLISSEMRVSDIWNLEALGITEPATTNHREEQELLARSHFRETVQVNSEGRYEVSLPWVGGKSQLPTNRRVAEARLQNVVKKLQDCDRLRDYESVFDGWLDEGMIELAEDADLEGKMHYLPHRAVFKEIKTTPVRPVFDASCKIKNRPSLNDCLEKGQNLLELIPSLILRFRQNPIGLIADIRKAFLMISVKPEDRDYIRFLWWKGGDRGKAVVYRHKRVVFGLNCSPFLLLAVIEHHLDKCSDQLTTATQLFKSLYVDNCVTSVTSKAEMDAFIDEATSVMSLARMDLRMWEHNVLSQLEVSSCPGNEACEENPITTVLGIQWDKVTDTLFIEVAKFTVEKEFSKRTLLSATQRVFDPMGYLSPATLLPKKLLQQAWEIKSGWDDMLPKDISEQFGKWIEDMHGIDSIRIQRFVQNGVLKKREMELHCFCDVSKSAYAAVVYLRCVGVDDRCAVNILQAKSRVSPTKPLSIPRLEP